MKKFLTVLLALSVVFTYSFSAVGAVFADTDATGKAQALTDAKAVAEKMVTTYYDDAMKAAKTATKNSVNTAIADTFTDTDYDAAWAKVDVKGLLQTAINEAYVEEAKGFSKFAEDDAVATYAAKVFGVSTNDNSGNELAPSAIVEALKTKIAAVAEKEALLNLYNAKKAEILTALDKVDYSLYLDKVDANDAAGRTYLKQAQDKVADAKKTAAGTNMVLNVEDIDASGIADAIALVNGVITDNVEAIMISGTTYPSRLYKVKGVMTKDEVAAADRENEANLATIKAAIQKNYVAAMNAGAVKANADAYVTVCNYLAENGYIKSANAWNAGTQEDGIPAYGTANWSGAVKAIEDLTAFAAKYKAEKDATGAYVRDAAAVDAEVEKATNKTYGEVAGVTIPAGDGQSITDAENHIKAMSAKTDAANLAFAKEAAKAAVEAKKAAVDGVYYPLEAKVIAANLAAIVAEIEAATTVADVDAAKAKIADATKDNGKSTGTELDTIEAVDAGIPWADATKTPKSDLADVNYQINHLNRGLTVLDAGYIDATDTQIKAAIAKIYGEAGARDEKGYKAAKVDAAAVAASLPTVGAKAAAKKAYEDAIKALPANPTEADLAAVQAAADAVAAYTKLGGSVDATLAQTLNKAKASVRADLQKSLIIAFAQLDKTDKAAVKALIEKVNAAVELVVTDGVLEDSTTETALKALQTSLSKEKANASDTQGILQDIRDAELAKVIKAINAIPLNVTAEDKAVVEAARKAYDAFVAEWTDYTIPYDAASKVGAKYQELALAEAALSVLDKDAKIKAVEAFKIKTTTKRYTGSKMRVNWTVASGDESAIDGYRIYYSTKKSNSGYKYLAKTTKKYINHTSIKKSVKKGTRVYYRVRAYVEIDGQRYFSDYSTVGNRIWK